MFFIIDIGDPQGETDGNVKNVVLPGSLYVSGSTSRIDALSPLIQLPLVERNLRSCFTVDALLSSR